jgi:hypothetical protein
MGIVFLSQGVAVTTRPLLEPKLTMSGSISLPTLRPHWDITGLHLPLTYLINNTKLTIRSHEEQAKCENRFRLCDLPFKDM